MNFAKTLCVYVIKPTIVAKVSITTTDLGVTGTSTSTNDKIRYPGCSRSSNNANLVTYKSFIATVHNANHGKNIYNANVVM